MDRDCPGPRKEEGGKSGQTGEVAQIELNLSEVATYINVEGFEMLSIVFEEKINEPETIEADITGIEGRILEGTDEHSFLNKGNETQVPVKAVSPWWMLLDSQYTVNVIINRELVKDICDTRGRFFRVHFNSGTRIIRTKATLPGFGTVWFDDRCIANILSISK